MCRLLSAQVQGWLRLTVSPASANVWIAECGSTQLVKSNPHLCLTDKSIAIWLEVLIQEEIMTHFRRDNDQPIH